MSEKKLTLEELDAFRAMLYEEVKKAHETNLFMKEHNIPFTSLERIDNKIKISNKITFTQVRKANIK